MLLLTLKILRVCKLLVRFLVALKTCRISKIRSLSLLTRKQQLTKKWQNVQALLHATPLLSLLVLVSILLKKLTMITYLIFTFNSIEKTAITRELVYEILEYKILLGSIAVNNVSVGAVKLL